MKLFLNQLTNLIYLAGIAQITLALFSIVIPFVLKWKEEMSKVNALIRNVFYTYSVYIFATNIWFGIISILFPTQLKDGSGLSSGITVFIALYWWGRVFVQFVFGKADGKPQGFIFVIGEIALWILFLALSLIYSVAAFYNLKWIG